MLAACPLLAANAQDYSGTDPLGTVSYCLPSTTIAFEVEAMRETFHAGPYAAYASKYLGMEVRRADAVSYTITDVKMVPYMEADQSARYILDVKSVPFNASFLELTAQGLVSVVNPVPGDGIAWRFPADTLRNPIGLPRRPSYSSANEKKAAEVASVILELRKKRYDIVTGNTDATYSGEAMGAAIAELTRLEEEYMLMFAGYSEYQTQKLTFDLVPQKDRSSQMYVAFRLSETEGLVSADNLSGKPIVLEITPERIAEPVVEQKKDKPVKDLVYAVYRIPAICDVRLSDGSKTLLQGRIPIYQFGMDSTLPLSLSVK